jgi:modulator of FtsH protease
MWYDFNRVVLSSKLENDEQKDKRTVFSRVNYEQTQSTYVGAEQGTQTGSFQRLMRTFTIAVLVCFIGTFFGMMVPPAFFLPLAVIQLIMMIAALVIQWRGKAIGYPFVFSFVFLTGVVLYPAVAYYTFLGGAIVTQAFLLTVIIFGALTLYAYYSKRDFSFLGSMLMVGLLVLIGAGLISLFTGGMGGTLNLVITVLGVLIFSGFVLYDVSQYKHGVEERMMPLAVLSMFLSFINLFLYILRFLAIFLDE